VGGLLAGLLARRGDIVTCLAGDKTATALRTQGITVRSDRFGTFTVPVGAATVLDEPVDACFVTVKATQLESALDRVPAKAPANALVVARRLDAQIDTAAVIAALDALPETMQSSMQRDAQAGRPIEVEAMGAVVRAAQRVGVAVPVTGRLVADLRGRDEGPEHRQ